MKTNTVLIASAVLALAAGASARAQETQGSSAPPASPTTAPAAAPAVTPSAVPAAADPAAAKPDVAPTDNNAPKTDRVGPPPAGKGQVVFFRPSRLAGMALSFSVHEGDKGVGKLGNGSYFVVAADPGPHSYSIQSEAKDTLNLEVEAGETQYVMETLGMGVMMARPHLTPSDQNAFEKLNLKASEKTASDLKPKA